MKFDRRTLVSLGLISSAVVALDSSADACPYLPTDSAPPIEYFLPTSAIQDFSRRLPALEFEGVKPIAVTRKTLPFGSEPRIVIERYSAEPTIEYNEVDGTIVVSSRQCYDVRGPHPGTGTSSRTSAAALTPFQKAYSWIGLTAMASMLWGGPATVAMAAVATLIPQASFAQESDMESCLPAVKVVVEAPAGTMDAVEACWAEVKNPMGICPEPFPTFPTCNEIMPECKVVVVGAATGGLYSAIRYVYSNAL